MVDLSLLWYLLQALQAQACHENMVKVGGYILGEFGNLIAGDSRSRCVHFTITIVFFFLCDQTCLYYLTSLLNLRCTHTKFQ